MQCSCQRRQGPSCAVWRRLSVVTRICQRSAVQTVPSSGLRPPSPGHGRRRTAYDSDSELRHTKMGCFEIKAALYDQVCRNCDGGNAASQARIESRKRALINDPGLRKKFETSVGVTTTNLNIRRPKPRWIPCAVFLIGSHSHDLQQIGRASPVCTVYFVSSAYCADSWPWRNCRNT